MGTKLRLALRIKSAMLLSTTLPVLLTIAFSCADERSIERCIEGSESPIEGDFLDIIESFVLSSIYVTFSHISVDANLKDPMNGYLSHLSGSIKLRMYPLLV
jgi:hypothetical protein